MGLEGRRNIVAKAERVVFDREVAYLQTLLRMAKNQKKDSVVNQELESEVARLKPDGKYDHEEVHAESGRYTSGRKDRQKPRLSQIKSEKWAKDGQ